MFTFPLLPTSIAQAVSFNVIQYPCIKIIFFPIFTSVFSMIAPYITVLMVRAQVLKRKTTCDT